MLLQMVRIPYFLPQCSIPLCRCTSFLIRSSADGHLGCFQILAMVNCATMNIGVHISFLIGVSSFLGYIPRSGITGSNRILDLVFDWPTFAELMRCLRSGSVVGLGHTEAKQAGSCPRGSQNPVGEAGR
uniref:Uncharacterized protein n=1 Tax=Myotis myotis TaxID=51298 RepID=A0A7J8ALE6_MYOMY|nr:hypothetical protein mMyoMyo1_007817 [Myotis myotis]